MVPSCVTGGGWRVSGWGMRGAGGVCAHLGLEDGRLLGFGGIISLGDGERNGCKLLAGGRGYGGYVGRRDEEPDVRSSTAGMTTTMLL